MMKNKRKATIKKRLPLPEDLEKRLSVYALAAGAAGMVGLGALASPPPAEASIVTNTTPISIGPTVKTTLVGVIATGKGQLSINGSPVLSFKAYRLKESFGTGTSHGNGYLKLSGGDSLKDGVIAGPLSAGVSIGSRGSFTARSTLAHNKFGSSPGKVGGLWANKTGYLGFKFFEGSKSYFGWAHLKVTANGKNGETGYISEFAYDTVPGQSIKAGQTAAPVPEPPTLALLALGAVGLLALRKKRQVEAERESAVKG